MLFQCQVDGCNTYWSSILLFVVSDCAKSCAVNGSRNFANFEWSSHVQSLELPVGLVLSNGAKEVMSVVQVPQEVLALMMLTARCACKRQHTDRSEVTNGYGVLCGCESGDDGDDSGDDSENGSAMTTTAKV